MSQMPTDAPMSASRLAGDLLFVSGQVGHDHSGRPLESFEAQARAAIEALGALLTDAGANYEDVVRTTVYLTSQNYFAQMNSIYREYFAAPFPTRSTVVAQLAADGFVFEIDAIAVMRRSVADSV
jgi:2-iminobutanoate/2-iminopropanoate deaminase